MSCLCLSLLLSPRPPYCSLASSCMYATLPPLTLLMPVPLLIPPLLLFLRISWVARGSVIE